MKKCKRLTVFILALLLVVVITGCSSRTPAQVAVYSIDAVLEEAKAGGITGTVYDILNGGSINAQVDVAALADSLGGKTSADLDATAEGTLYFDLDATKMALQAALALDGDDVMDAGVYLSADELAVESETLLGGDAFGLNFAEDSEALIDLIDELSGEASAFHMDTEALSGASLLELGQLKSELETLKDKYLLKISELLTKYAEIDSRNEKMSFDTGSANAQIITVTMDSDALYSFVEGLYDFLYDDDELYDLFDRLFGSAGLDFMDLLDNADFDYLLDTIDSHDIDLVMEFCVEKSDGSLMELDIDMDVDDESGSISLLIGPDIALSTKLSAKAKSDYVTRSVTYTVSEDSKDFYSSKLSLKVEDSGETTMKLKVDWDKSNGRLELELETDVNYPAYKQTQQYSLNGSMEIDGDEITLEPYELVIENLGDSSASPYRDTDAFTNYILPLKFVFNRKNPVPDFPDYDSIADLSADEFMELMNDISSELQDASEMIGGGAVSPGTSAFGY